MELSSNWTSEDTDIAWDLQLYTDDLPDALSELLDEDAGFVLSQPKLNKDKCYLQFNGQSSSAREDSPCIKNPMEQFKRSMNIHLSDRTRIVSITVISESKLIEVFVGTHEEYLGSFCSTIVEQFTDSLLCRTVIDLGKPQSIVKLVFKNTYDDSSLMVYGVFARKVVKVSGESQFPSISRFSSNHLDSVLSDHGVTTLSKEASMFKQVLQQYNDRGREGGAVATPSFPLSGLLPLLGASGSGGPDMLSNLAAMVQKQYPPSCTGQFEAEASNLEERCKKIVESGTDLVSTNGSNNNGNSSISKSKSLVTDSDKCSSNSFSPSGPLNFHVPHTEVSALDSYSRKLGLVSEKSVCEGVARMDISPGYESHHSSSSLSSYGSETPTPDHLLQRGTDATLESKTQVNGNSIHSLPVIDSSDVRTSGQPLNVQENGSHNCNLSEHLIGLFENIIDKKLAAFEKRIETMVTQKLSETSTQIFTKLNSIEMSLVGVPDRESSSGSI